MKSTEIRDMVMVFEEATAITMTLVAFPVLLLVLGVFLDKTFSTTPIFILIGILCGVGIGIWRAMKINSEYQTKMKKLKKNRKENPTSSK